MVYPHPSITHKFFFCFVIGICLLIAGLVGALSESELLLLAFYGFLIGGGVFLLGYSAVLWRRAEQESSAHSG